ncbi:hypothetical protein M514_07103 [Trichuris suis]|uniref:Uncharacterized protein n=1 Tax=Trichuris suis TaxID=68888 RepID=A0A085NPM1_9BILA|nr:hypothetical protein M514_07103 [Trichuris suis]
MTITTNSKTDFPKPDSQMLRTCHIYESNIDTAGCLPLGKEASVRLISASVDTLRTGTDASRKHRKIKFSRKKLLKSIKARHLLLQHHYLVAEKECSSCFTTRKLKPVQRICMPRAGIEPATFRSSV